MGGGGVVMNLSRCMHARDTFIIYFMCLRPPMNGEAFALFQTSLLFFYLRNAPPEGVFLFEPCLTR